MRSRTPLSCLILALVAAGCGGGGGGGGTPTSPTPPPPGGSGQVLTVTVTENSYSPKSITISPGDTVRWVFRGQDTTHTVTALNGAFDSGFVFSRDGAVYERTFAAAENGRTYEYSCQSHSVCCLMRGSVRVGSSSPVPGPSYE